jgi:hypothetical protein
MMMMMTMTDDDDADDDDDGEYHGDHHDHGSHIHLHIESPSTWHVKNTQPFRNSGAEQRQGCTEPLSNKNMANPMDFPLTG